MFPIVAAHLVQSDVGKAWDFCSFRALAMEKLRKKKLFAGSIFRGLGSL